MNTEIKVIYTCQNLDCAKPFDAYQGSKQRYCTECLMGRMRHKGKFKIRKV